MVAPSSGPSAQLLGPAKREALADAMARIAKQHHDALAVELFGVQAAGLGAAELESLIEQGRIDPDKLGGFRIPGTPFDVFEFVARVARLLEGSPIEQQIQMRRWSLPQWVAAIAASPPMAASVPLPAGAVYVGAPGDGLLQPDVPASAAGDAPAWMGAADRAAYWQARRRGADFCRGLGNAIAEELEDAVAEKWAGEDIVAEVQPRLRAERVEQIRAAVGDAIATHRDPRKLASDLGHATGNWAHNWQRVAETELQGALNEGAVLAALDRVGPGAQIARVPESEACEDCERVFLGDDGTPIVWPVAELIGNGTNVGRKRAQWRATIWPVHPRCRCGTLTVPAGYTPTRGGALRRV